jgi:hypothetical protein
MSLNKKICLYLIIPVLSSCAAHFKGLVAFKEQNKFGYKTIYGKVVIPPRYENVGWGSLNRFGKVKSGNNWGLINREGKMIIPAEYDFIEDNYEIDQNLYRGLILVRKNGFYGFIDKTNKTIIPCIYSYPLYIHDNGMIVTEKDGMWGIINLKNETIIPFEYENLLSFSENTETIQAQKNGHWGFIDRNNNVLIPFDYEDLGYRGWSEDLHAAKKNNKWGFIDHQNHEVIPFMYDRVSNFAEGLAFVELQFLFKCGYIDHQNHTVIPFIYKGGANSDFKNGIALVVQNDRSGYIDKTGKIIIPIKYNRLGEFCNGYAWTRIDKRFADPYDTIQENIDSLEGYIDKNGVEYLHPVPVGSHSPVKFPKAPDVLPDYSKYLKSWHRTQPQPWTLEMLLDTALTALKDEPHTYPDLCSLKEICIGYGMSLSTGNYSENFICPDQASWDIFKNETIYKILSSEKLRQTAWDWVSVPVKKTIQSLNPFHKQAYKDIARYMKDYINHYNIAKVKSYLVRDEKNFAHKDMNGHDDPCRKLSAFVDRLIIVHHVISVKDAKTWINKIADEVLAW